MAKRLNEAGLRQAFRYAAALGDTPVILAGDLNDSPETSPTLFQALQTGLWKDAALLEADKTEPPSAPPPPMSRLGQSRA